MLRLYILLYICTALERKYFYNNKLKTNKL